MTYTNNMKWSRRTVLLIAGVCITAGHTQRAAAESITQSALFAVDTTTSLPPVDSTAISLNMFNPTLGTLTGISLSVTGQANAVLAAITNSTIDVLGTSGSTTIGFSMSGPGFLASIGDLTAMVSNGTVKANSSGAPFAATYFAGPAASISITDELSPSDFSQYEGTGSASVLFSFLTGTISGSGGKGSAGSFTALGTGGQASGDLSLKYTYTPVPIPAAAWLLVSGMGAIGTFTFRRRRSTVT